MPTRPSVGGNTRGWAPRVYDSAPEVPLADGSIIRLPTVPGYLATKLAAWLDRSALREYKDASDIALALWWYQRSETVMERLYTTQSRILERYELDPDLGASHLLGVDARHALGAAHEVIGSRWERIDKDLLAEQMRLPTALHTPELSRRLAFVARAWAGTPRHGLAT